MEELLDARRSIDEASYPERTAQLDLLIKDRGKRKKELSPPEENVVSHKGAGLTAWWGYSGGSKVTLERRDPATLILRHSRAAATLSLLTYVVSVGFFAWWQLGKPLDLATFQSSLAEIPSRGFAAWFAVLVTLAFFAIGCLKLPVVLFGRAFTVDRNTQEVTRNGKVVARFDAIENVYVRRVAAHKSSDYFLLGARLNSGDSVKFGGFKSREKATAAADDVADLVRRPVQFHD